MNLEAATALIQREAEHMNELYGKVVFDEWAVVSFRDQQGRLLAYSGPRKDSFLQNFSKDLEGLRAEILTKKHEPGHFEFARHGTGQLLDAFMVIGNELYLIWNATNNSMQGITKDARWLQAQVPFAELADQFRANPLTT